MQIQSQKKKKKKDSFHQLDFQIEANETKLTKKKKNKEEAMEQNHNQVVEQIAEAKPQAASPSKKQRIKEKKL